MPEAHKGLQNSENLERTTMWMIQMDDIDPMQVAKSDEAASVAAGPAR